MSVDLTERLSNLQGIIFDMDGVLVDSEPVHAESFRIFLEERGIEFTEEFINSLVGHSVDSNIAEVNRRFLKGKSLNIEQGVKERDAIYLKLIQRRQLQPIDGIEELLFFCAERGIKRGLASSSVRSQVKAVLHNLNNHPEIAYDIDTQFDVIVCGDDVPNKKPAPDIFARALELLCISADQCLAIEDSAAGIASAQSNGIFCIALTNQYLREEDLKKADLSVSSLLQVVDLILKNNLS